MGTTQRKITKTPRWQICTCRPKWRILPTTQQHFLRLWPRLLSRIKPPWTTQAAPWVIRMNASKKGIKSWYSPPLQQLRWVTTNCLWVLLISITIRRNAASTRSTEMKRLWATCPRYWMITTESRWWASSPTLRIWSRQLNCWLSAKMWTSMRPTTKTGSLSREQPWCPRNSRPALPPSKRQLMLYRTPITTIRPFT